MEFVTPESVGLSSTRLQRIDRVMQAYVDRGQLAGMIAVVLRRGRVAHFGIYGQMDIARGKPMEAETIFRIFSMTKPITSLAVMMLLEEGAFHLQTPIAAFIPELASVQVLSDQADASAPRVALARPITIHDLLTHSSGLGYGLNTLLPVDAMLDQAQILRMDETLAEKMARLAQFPLHHQPGLRHTYSIATDVLGRLVEVVSGMPLDQFFQQRIFAPLGMTETAFWVPPQKAARLAALYTTGAGGELVDVQTLAGGELPQIVRGAWVNKAQQPAFLSGGAGLVATSADYLRFGMLMRNQGALEGVRLLSRKTIELMTAAHLRPEQFFYNGASYGLGFGVLTSPALAQMPGSAGAYEASGAAHTNFWYDPQEDLMGLLMVQYVYTPSCMVGMDLKVLAQAAIED